MIVELEEPAGEGQEGGGLSRRRRRGCLERNSVCNVLLTMTPASHCIHGRISASGNSRLIPVLYAESVRILQFSLPQWCIARNLSLTTTVTCSPRMHSSFVVVLPLVKPINISWVSSPHSTAGGSISPLHKITRHCSALLLLSTLNTPTAAESSEKVRRRHELVLY